MKLITQILVITLIAVAGLAILSLFSTGDFIGALSDVGLKLFFLATKMILFALFLLIMVKYLDFAEVFENASRSTAHGLRAVGAAIIILAFSILLIGY